MDDSTILSWSRRLASSVPGHNNAFDRSDAQQEVALLILHKERLRQSCYEDQVALARTIVRNHFLDKGYVFGGVRIPRMRSDDCRCTQDGKIGATTSASIDAANEEGDSSPAVNEFLSSNRLSPESILRLRNHCFVKRWIENNTSVLAYYFYGADEGEPAPSIWRRDPHERACKGMDEVRKLIAVFDTGLSQQERRQIATDMYYRIKKAVASSDEPDESQAQKLFF